MTRQAKLSHDTLHMQSMGHVDFTSLPCRISLHTPFMLPGSNLLCVPVTACVCFCFHFLRISHSPHPRYFTITALEVLMLVLELTTRFTVLFCFCSEKFHLPLQGN